MYMYVCSFPCHCKLYCTFSQICPFCFSVLTFAPFMYGSDAQKCPHTWPEAAVLLPFSGCFFHMKAWNPEPLCYKNCESLYSRHLAREWNCAFFQQEAKEPLPTGVPVQAGLPPLESSTEGGGGGGLPQEKNDEECHPATDDVKPKLAPSRKSKPVSNVFYRDPT